MSHDKESFKIIELPPTTPLLAFGIKSETLKFLKITLDYPNNMGECAFDNSLSFKSIGFLREGWGLVLEHPVYKAFNLIERRNRYARKDLYSFSLITN